MARKVNNGLVFEDEDGELVFQENALDVLANAAGLGLTLPLICGVLGISTTTLHTYLKNPMTGPAIADALARGKGKSAYAVGTALYKRAVSGDVGAIRWYEMTRLNMSEKAEVGVHDQRMVVGEAERVDDEDEWSQQAIEGSYKRIESK
jgi:hypothetical protein